MPFVFSNTFSETGFMRSFCWDKAPLSHFTYSIIQRQIPLVSAFGLCFFPFFHSWPPFFLYPASLVHNSPSTCMAGSWFRHSTQLAPNEPRAATWMEVCTAEQDNNLRLCGTYSNTTVNSKTSGFNVHSCFLPVVLLIITHRQF